MSSESSVKTLDALKAKLRERMDVDIATLPTFEHKASGIAFRLRKMNRDGYDAAEGAEVVDDDIKDWTAADRAKIIRYRRDKAFLLHGVLFDDGAKPDEEFVEMLLKGAWDGENRALVHEIRKLNPPRDTLALEYQAVIGQSRLTVVFYRLLKEAGALEKLRDWLLEKDGSEKAKALAEDLRKWESTLETFEVLMDAAEAAKHFGVGVYERQSVAHEPVSG
jgi:hypothetical protein